MKWLNLLGVIIAAGCQAVAIKEPTMAPWLAPVGALIALLVEKTKILPAKSQ